MYVYAPCACLCLRGQEGIGSRGLKGTNVCKVGNGEQICVFCKSSKSQHPSKATTMHILKTKLSGRELGGVLYRALEVSRQSGVSGG